MFLHNVLPDERRGLLKAALAANTGPVRLLEAHSGLSALVANEASYTPPGGTPRDFHGIWLSGLTETASRGLPDIELQGMLPRMGLVREILTVTDKPLVVDGDTGGAPNQLRYLVRQLESMGVSAVIVEDKIFPKHNSLDHKLPQDLEHPEVFARKLIAGKQAQRSQDFMLMARIEALIAGAGMDEALLRARHYVLAGADAIVIHSRAAVPDEVIAFSRAFQQLGDELGRRVPLVCIPTIYNSTPETLLYESGFQLIIHANYLLRSALMAMTATAESILAHGRAHEAEAACVPLATLFATVESQIHVPVQA